MAHLPRLHVPGGIYSVLLRGNGGESIFRDDEERRDFSRLVARSLQRCQVRAHAFCWMGDHVRLALEIADVPIGRFMQRIAAQHSLRVHRRQGTSGHLFERGYRAVLIQGNRHLPELVRHVHLAPVRAGVVRDAADYPWSGHRAYLKRTRVAWLTTHVVLGMLSQRAAAYTEYVARGGDEELDALFEQGLPDEPRVIGDEEFLGSLALRQRGARASLDDLIDGTASVLDVRREDVLSLSRRRMLALARALITWQATRTGVATLSEVAQRLGRDPSTLFVGMERYRALRPELFGPASNELAPAALTTRSWKTFLPRQK